MWRSGKLWCWENWFRFSGKAIEVCLCVIDLGQHYDDVIMSTIASQITSLTIVYSTVYSDADQRRHQSSASLAFVWGNNRWPVKSRTKGQLRGKCFHLMTSSWKILQIQCNGTNYSTTIKQRSTITILFSHKGPVTRKMFPFDNVIMQYFSQVMAPDTHYVSYIIHFKNC